VNYKLIFSLIFSNILLIYFIPILAEYPSSRTFKIKYLGLN
jgi:hypothetical protein